MDVLPKINLTMLAMLVMPLTMLDAHFEYLAVSATLSRSGLAGNLMHVSYDPRAALRDMRDISGMCTW